MAEVEEAAKALEICLDRGDLADFLGQSNFVDFQNVFRIHFWRNEKTTPNYREEDSPFGVWTCEFPSKMWNATFWNDIQELSNTDWFKGAMISSCESRPTRFGLVVPKRLPPMVSKALEWMINVFPSDRTFRFISPSRFHARITPAMQEVEPTNFPELLMALDHHYLEHLMTILEKAPALGGLPLDLLGVSENLPLFSHRNVLFFCMEEKLEWFSQILALCPGLENCQDEQGFTLLHLAVEKGLMSEVGVLLECGASANPRNHRGLTPLDIAEEANRFIMALLLQSKGAIRSQKGYVLPRRKLLYEPHLPFMSGIHPMDKELTFQLASDLHLEFYSSNSLPKDLIHAAAPILLLLGDIGYPGSAVFDKFIRQQCSQFQLIIFVPGNHEYYNRPDTKTPHTMLSVKKKLVALTKRFQNFVYLDNHSVSIGRFRICGTTLWGKLNPKDKAEVKIKNDYNLIFNDNGSLLNAGATNRFHEDAVKWLESELAEAEYADETMVVLSHFPPLPECNMSKKFIADCSHLMQSCVAYWFYGHTHESMNFIRNKTQLVSNQRGYVTLGKRVADFNPEQVIRVMHQPSRKHATQRVMTDLKQVGYQEHQVLYERDDGLLLELRDDLDDLDAPDLM